MLPVTMSSRRRPGSIYQSATCPQRSHKPLNSVSCTAMDPGLPHGSSPWAEGPRDDSVYSNRKITNYLKALLNSRVAAGLAPQAELFLHDPVGKAEQHRFLRHPVGMRHPARHDKDF